MSIEPIQQFSGLDNIFFFFIVVPGTDGEDRVSITSPGSPMTSAGFPKDYAAVLKPSRTFDS